MPARQSNPAQSEVLLQWYDRHARVLPWRARPGESADPYAVWLSEIMLQQTTVVAVKPYYERFLNLWPTVKDLASAPRDDVLTEWAGLGYYARARNLHACAVKVSEELGGIFPDTEAGLLELPGIGPYTAAAIASIAFGRKAVVMDGNVERVMARLHAETDPLPAVKPVLKAHAAALTPEERAGDYAQAVMDLGATICTPKSPACVICPWQEPCQAQKQGMAETLPRKTPKKKRPTRRGVAFWLSDGEGHVYLRQRPDKGLLGGMMEVPSTPWEEAEWSFDEAVHHAPASGDWRALDGVVRHTFTHFHLELEVAIAQLPERPIDGTWAQVDQLGDYALPSIMQKVAKHALRAS